MAEHPLLPDAELRRLHDLVKHVTALDKSHLRAQSRLPPSRSTSTVKLPARREALLAGTAIHLQIGDLLIAAPGDSTAASLLPPPLGEAELNASPDLPRSASPLLLAVAMAAALHGSGTEKLVLAYAQAGARDGDWSTALSWAQQHNLPFVLVCADASGAAAFKPSAKAADGTLHWNAVKRVAASLKLPILSVDGEDAVAVYRVMQESVLRARGKAGPAIIWAMLPSPAELAAGRSSSSWPIRRLERYLRTRNISL